jgi:hypothetical protein
VLVAEPADQLRPQRRARDQEMAERQEQRRKREVDHETPCGSCKAGHSLLRSRKRNNTVVSKWNMRESAIFAFSIR